MMLPDSFAATLDIVYAAAVAPERRPDMLRRLAVEFHCHFTGTVASNTDRSAHLGMAVGVERDAHQRFLQRFHQRSPFRLAAPRQYAGEVIPSSDILPRAALERTEMYEAFFRPHDLGEGLRFTLWQGGEGVETISVVRSWKAGRFAPEEIAYGRALAPHLQRMAEVARHLRGAELLTRSAYETLGLLPQPTLLLNREGGLIHANEAAERLLRENDGLTLRRAGALSRSCLATATASATRRLETAISSAARPGGAASALRLARPSGRPALALIAMPMRGLQDFLFAAQPAVLLCIADPTQRNRSSPTLLGSLFGLTPAEALLATELLSGETPASIAAASGRSVNTVRNLLARLMAKTETRRQGDLIRLLSALPLAPLERTDLAGK